MAWAKYLYWRPWTHGYYFDTRGTLLYGGRNVKNPINSKFSDPWNNHGSFGSLHPLAKLGGCGSGSSGRTLTCSPTGKVSRETVANRWVNRVWPRTSRR